MVCKVKVRYTASHDGSDFGYRVGTWLQESLRSRQVRGTRSIWHGGKGKNARYLKMNNLKLASSSASWFCEGSVIFLPRFPRHSIKPPVNKVLTSLWQVRYWEIHHCGKILPVTATIPLTQTTRKAQRNVVTQQMYFFCRTKHYGFLCIVSIPLGKQTDGYRREKYLTGGPQKNIKKTSVWVKEVTATRIPCSAFHRSWFLGTWMDTSNLGTTLNLSTDHLLFWDTFVIEREKKKYIYDSRKYITSGKLQKNLYLRLCETILYLESYKYIHIYMEAIWPSLLSPYNCIQRSHCVTVTWD